jgi:hypothetical protein
MSKRNSRPAVKQADNFDRAPGYFADGLSMFAHRAASSKAPRPSAASRPQTVRQLIERNERILRELYAEHRAGIADPARLAKVRADIDIKQAWIARLWIELGENLKRGRA